jgi:DNA polymerase-1
MMTENISGIAKKQPLKKQKSKEDIVQSVLESIDFSELSDASGYTFIRIDNLIHLQAVHAQFLHDDPKVIAVDTETTGLRWKDQIIGISFSWSDAHNYYIPMRHLSEETQLRVVDCKDILNQMFSCLDKKYVFHNYKFDYHKLVKEGIEVGGEVHDTMLMHYVLDENESHKLKDLAVRFVDPSAHEYEKIIDQIRKKLARSLKIKIKEFGFENIPINLMVQYACRDTLYTLKLYEYFEPQISESEGVQKVYQRELDLLPALCAMEQFGAYVDQPLLLERSATLGEKIDDLRKEVIELAGQDFDLNSPSQLGKVLQSKGIHTRQYTPTGRMATNAKALKGVAARFPFVKKLLKFREQYKLKHTYTDPLCGFCDENSFIHCSYRQAVAVTGRLTCKSPSLQVIPRSAGIRDAFTPPSAEYLVVPIDLSQIELRVLAHYSKDPILMNAYMTQEDIHNRTAAEIFDVAIGDVTKAQRETAKPINFGIVYGMGASKLAETLEISPTIATQYIDAYMKRYAGVAKFITKYKRLAKKHGFVKNYFGRIRRLDSLKTADLEEWARERGYRQAVNFVIQSTAADMFKIILVRCHEVLKGKRTKMVMNIHDEIVFYWHLEELNLMPQVVKAFEDWNFSVPIIAEVSYSDQSWGAKQEW